MSKSRHIQKHSQAKEDLIELHSFLLRRNETTAARFLQETREAFDLFLRVPGIGSRWESPSAKTKGLRFVTVSRRFHDYLIFFRVVENGVTIITVVHGVRDLSSLIDPLIDGEQ